MPIPKLYTFIKLSMAKDVLSFVQHEIIPKLRRCFNSETFSIKKGQIISSGHNNNGTQNVDYKVQFIIELYIQFHII